MKRKFFCIFMIFILVVAIGNTGFTYADNEEGGGDTGKDKDKEPPETIIIEVPQPIKEDPNLVLQNVRMPEFEAGEEVELVIPLENTSSTSARNVRVSLLVDDLEDFPFELNRNTFSQ